MKHEYETQSCLQGSEGGARGYDRGNGVADLYDVNAL